MPQFEIELENGHKYQIDADTEEQAVNAAKGEERTTRAVAPEGELSEHTPTLMERVRQTGLGRQIFGPSTVEREAMIEKPVSPGVLLDTAFKFASPPPQLAKPIRAATDPVINLLPPTLGGIAEGTREAALGFPIGAAGLGMGKNISRAIMGLFTGEFALGIPEQATEFKKAVDAGDNKRAAAIATQALLTGGLLGLGAKHEISEMRKPKPVIVPPVEPPPPQPEKGVSDAISIKAPDAVPVQPAPGDSGAVGQGVREAVKEPSGAKAEEAAPVGQKESNVLLDAIATDVAAGKKLTPEQIDVVGKLTPEQRQAYLYLVKQKKVTPPYETVTPPEPAPKPSTVEPSAPDIGLLTPDDAVRQGVDRGDYNRAVDDAFRNERITEEQWKQRNENDPKKWPSVKVGDDVYVPLWRDSGKVTDVGYGWVEVTDSQGRKGRQNPDIELLSEWNKRHEEMKRPTVQPAAPPPEPTAEKPAVKLVRAYRRGSDIYVEVDASGGKVSPDEVAKAFSGPDRSVEAIVFEPNVLSVASGVAKFKITVGTPEGPYNEALAKKAYIDVLGTDQDITGKSVVEKAIPFEERLNKGIRFEKQRTGVEPKPAVEKPLTSLPEPKPAAPAGETGKGGTMERSTPRQGTPERVAIESEYDQLNAPTEAIYKQIADLEIQKERVKRYSQKWESLDKKISKLREKRDALEDRPEIKSVREKLRKAHSDDRLESKNPILVAKEKSELGDKTAYKKLEDDFVVEAKRQGFTDEQAKQMFLDAWGYTIHDEIGLPELVSKRGEMIRAEENARKSQTELESIPELSENEIRNAKSLIDNERYQPQNISKELDNLRAKSAERLAEKARKQSEAKQAKEQERNDTAQRILDTPENDWENFARGESKMQFGQLQLAKKDFGSMSKEDQARAKIYRVSEGGKPRWFIWLTREKALEWAKDRLKPTPEPLGPTKAQPLANTPLMREHANLKDQAPPGSLIAVRLGDFFEFFGNDADIAAKLLSPQKERGVTKRNDISMYGVPFHASEGYFRKLSDAGHRVAIADVEGIPKPGERSNRKITKIIEPTGDLGPTQGAGPGTPSAAQGPDPKAQIKQLADAFKASKAPISERIKALVENSFNLGERLESAKDAVARALSGLKASGDALRKTLTSFTEPDAYSNALGYLSEALERRGWDTRMFVKAVKRAIPQTRRRNAIAKWVDAGGDRATLEEGLANTPDRYKQAYQDALNLSGDDLIHAQNIQAYFEARLKEAIDAGVVEHGLEDYIHRIYPKDTPIKRQMLAYVQSGILSKNPSLAKKRFFQYDWEAEQEGFNPVQDFLPRITDYETSLSKAIAAREFIAKMAQMKAPDGRPVVGIKGVGIPLTDAETGERTGTLIKPLGDLKKNADPADANNYRGDYVNREYNALSKWKWVAGDTEGKPILLKGDVAIHPAFVGRVDALLEPSKVRYGRYPRLGQTLLNISSGFKQTMLDLSGFHHVQIALHAMEHRVMPWAINKEIDFSNPKVEGLLRGGVTLGGDYHTQREGLVGSSLTRQIPVLGPIMESYHSYLFQDLIPRIKMTMALHALDRNRVRFAKDLASGKMSEKALYRLTADQANAAFGEQNYIMLERSKTSQDMLRLIFLAPDFLEARGKFVGQALTKYGTEQRVALALGALTMWTLARLLNKALNDQWHNEPENLFSVVRSNNSYSLRTVQGDVLHLLERPVQFWMSRLNPVYGRTAMELATGRDWFGRKRSMPEQAWDAASNIVPISLRSSRERTMWESMLNAFGVTARRYNDVDDAFKLAQKWKAAHGVQERGEFIYDPDKDPLRALKIALVRQDEAGATKEIQRLLQSKATTIGKLNDYFNRYASMPFTGSRAHDRQWKATLSEDERKTVESGRQTKERIRKLYRLARNQYLAALITANSTP